VGVVLLQEVNPLPDVDRVEVLEVLPTPQSTTSAVIKALGVAWSNSFGNADC
jgi:hypothetical protein